MPRNLVTNKTLKLSEKQFVDRLEQWYVNEGFHTKREIDAGHGIADLVLTQLDIKQCELRKNNEQGMPLLKSKYFLTLSFIPDFKENKSPVGIDYLVDKTHISKNYLKYHILKELEEYGYVISVKDKVYLKVNGWIPLAKNVIAIEAKLKDWRSGLLQAIRYFSFADQVYLAIPNTVKVKKEQFRHFGVGLISFDTEKRQPKIVVKAKKSKSANLVKKNLVLEHIWSENYSDILPVRSSR